MHKMELGDSVYAAERIMKKRIRKVSFVYIAITPQLILSSTNLAKLARDHISAQLLFGIVNCRFRNNDRLLVFACTEFQNMHEWRFI